MYPSLDANLDQNRSFFFLGHQSEYALRTELHGVAFGLVQKERIAFHVHSVLYCSVLCGQTVTLFE